MRYLAVLVFALPAFAQLDSASFRAQFGTPLSRETFHSPLGFDIVVDYGGANQICRIQVPALMPTKETVSNADDMNHRMYDFLAKLIPEPVRGKELIQFAEIHGIVSVHSTEYEHITVSELKTFDDPFRERHITVTFKDSNCTAPAEQ
jgi:hypothetical protein